MSNQYECGCEHGGNCTRTTMCATQSAVEVLEVELADARQSATYWRKAYTRLESQLDAVRERVSYDHCDADWCGKSGNRCFYCEVSEIVGNE